MISDVLAAGIGRLTDSELEALWRFFWDNHNRQNGDAAVLWMAERFGREYAAQVEKITREWWGPLFLHFRLIQRGN